jgi:AmmeMemoRadiSam system protein B/AmmeMemoRadiSam system protein A
MSTYYRMINPLLPGLLVMLLAVPPHLTGQVRKPAVAGQFYPADPARLRADIKGYLDKANGIDLEEVLGISVPHAGYPYSAQVAAAGYKTVSGKTFDLIVVLAPSHQDYFQGGSIYPGEAYETPLGRMEVDRTAAAQLDALSPHFTCSEKGHGAREHSLEVQLPFIQELFPHSRLLPIVLGSFDWSSCEAMGKALAKVLQGRRALLVASTDLYHGYSYAECRKSDDATLAAFVRLNPRTLCEGLLNETFQACGGGPVTVLQVAASQNGNIQGKVIGRTNSNDVTGEKSGYVVGYAAVAYYLQEKGMNKTIFTPLSKSAQIELMGMAKESIKYYLKNGKACDFHSDTPALQEKRGVFVTITKAGALRGCIGMHEADIPLYKLVPDRAIAAAFEDPRFMPLQENEIDKIKIKISVYLTNVYEASLDEFVMGKHGIILMKGGRGATYLPEVPLEAGWKNKEEELASLCQKAGLPGDAWRKGAQIFLYETQVFDESVLK